MDKHVAVSRQLSMEQAVLQESLKKKCKGNKRLSLEKEELLWKLHNGTLCSPKRSPTSPPSPSSHLGTQAPSPAPACLTQMTFLGARDRPTESLQD
ncbi:hypothetical protein E5288_WYG015941 [Bos mutus]|uniref:Uncharacterized protein n=1 Tax=Bos mutus TaxID=72004 RepID=A0A6B0S1B5_9CETA|nr:hypothetical protein [Bos mutus]